MKMIMPKMKDVKFSSVMRIRGHIYYIPNDIDSLYVHVSEEPHGWVIAILAILLAVLLAPFTMGISLILFWLAYRTSRIEQGTIECTFTNGVYIRGFTRNRKELKLAQRYAVGPRPYIEPEAPRNVRQLRRIK